jgi:hypothetical protein
MSDLQRKLADAKAAQEAREDGELEAYQDLVRNGPAGLVLAEAFLAVTDFLPDGADPFVDGYRDRYYSLTS